MVREGDDDFSDLYGVSWNIEGVSRALGLDAASLRDEVLGDGFRFPVMVGDEHTNLDLYPRHGVLRLGRRDIPLDIHGIDEPNIGPEGVTFERRFPNETLQLALNRNRELALYVGPTRRGDPGSGRPSPLHPQPVTEPPRWAAAQLAGIPQPPIKLQGGTGVEVESDQTPVRR